MHKNKRNTLYRENSSNAVGIIDDVYILLTKYIGIYFTN